MLDFSFTKDAAISQVELAKALGVSRVTVNMWINGRMHPHHLHERRISAKLDALREAVAAGEIPPVTTEGREQAIADAVASATD